jgi:hypothetical protein
MSEDMTPCYNGFELLKEQIETVISYLDEKRYKLFK